MPLRGYHRVGGPNATLTELGFGGSGPVVPQYPAAGTEVSREYRETYGSMLMVNGNTYWGSTGYHVVLNDGLGGTYETDEITPRPNTGNVIANNNNYSPPYPEIDFYNFGGPVGGRYRKYYVAVNYYYDGTGGFYSNSNGYEYYKAYGELITSETSNSLTYFSANETYIPNGTYMSTDYYWDGNGGYYTNYGGGGSYYGYGTVIQGISQNDNYSSVGNLGNIFNGTYTTNNYIWDGNGGITTGMSSGGSYYSYGTFIGYDSMSNYNYYWDGNGGYYGYYNYGGW